jgi:hypothetical protein
MMNITIQNNGQLGGLIGLLNNSQIAITSLTMQFTEVQIKTSLNLTGGLVGFSNISIIAIQTSTISVSQKCTIYCGGILGTTISTQFSMNGSLVSLTTSATSSAGAIFGNITNCSTSTIQVSNSSVALITTQWTTQFIGAVAGYFNNSLILIDTCSFTVTIYTSGNIYGIL